MPVAQFPKLQDWGDVLEPAEDSHGAWPMLGGPWHAHWDLFALNEKRMRDIFVKWEMAMPR